MEEGNRKIAEWLNDHEHKEFSVYISGHEPYNFRDPAYLLEALAATRWNVEWWYYEQSPEDGMESGYNVEITDPDDDNTVIGVASAPELIQALWEALVEAVDGGLGGEDA